MFALGKILQSLSTVSTPFRNGTTIVSFLSIGLQASAAASSAPHFTAKIITSTAPMSEGLSVASHGIAFSCPFGPSKIKPFSFMAAR
jgi:hypothetical protein